MKHYALAVFLLSAIAGGAAAASGCGDASYPSFFEWSGDAGADAPDPDVVFLLPTGPYSDFPPNPIIDGADPDAGTGAAPGNSPTLFGAAVAASAGGPCLMEPEIGAMYPRNWLRPRFRWIPFGGLADDPGAPSDAGGRASEGRDRA